MWVCNDGSTGDIRVLGVHSLRSERRLVKLAHRESWVTVSVLRGVMRFGVFFSVSVGVVCIRVGPGWDVRAVLGRRGGSMVDVSSGCTVGGPFWSYAVVPLDAHLGRTCFFDLGAALSLPRCC